MKVTRSKKNNKGFSLVELIVVIAIMAVLIGVLAPQFIGWVAKSKKSTDLQNAQSLASEIAVQIAEDDKVDDAIEYEAVATDATYPVKAVPAVKLDSKNQYYYAVDAEGNVHIAIAAKDATKVTATSDVYPTVEIAEYQPKAEKE